MLKPLLFRAFLYKSFALLNSSSLTDNDERLIFTIVGNCSKMFSEWLELVFTLSGLSLGFPYRKHFTVNRLRVISKKSVVVKCVSILIFSLSLWEIAITSFLKRWSLGPFAFSITDNPSSLYKPIFSLSMILYNFSGRYIPTSSQTSTPSCDPIVTSDKAFSPFFI